MIVCPDTSPRGTNLPGEHESFDFGSGASFYLDATTPGYDQHYRMETYLVEELIQLLLRNFPINPKKIGLFGHSMGGHGALVLGLRHPHLFQSISAFAPICAPTECPWGVKAFQGYLGEDRELWNNYDATKLLQKFSGQTPILIDQGTKDDFLLTQLKPELLLKVAQEKSYPLQFRYQEGYAMKRIWPVILRPMLPR